MHTCPHVQLTATNQWRNPHKSFGPYIKSRQITLCIAAQRHQQDAQVQNNGNIYENMPNGTSQHQWLYKKSTNYTVYCCTKTPARCSGSGIYVTWFLSFISCVNHLLISWDPYSLRVQRRTGVTCAPARGYLYSTEVIWRLICRCANEIKRQTVED